MKYIKSYILFFLMVFAVTGCTTDDLKDDVNDLKDRVTLIEEQVKLLNDNLAVIAYILDPQNKTIANVETPTKDQYVITLSNGEKLTLTIGKPGTIDEPEITIGEDGMWYVNGESTGVVAVGTDGKNGEGYPEFRVEKGKWQVRFGDGAWSDVEGGDVAGGVSLGDQIFESAEVDGDKFIVTLKKDGSVHTLPIVETLKCIIDKSGLTLDKEDFLVVNRDERVIVPVQIEGENMQVTCPQGWRVTLNKLDVVDEKGNNYQLYIFAPVSGVKAMTRAVADNTADVTVQVQKGAFWAVDKIQVRLPKDYSNNLVKYNDEMPVSVGGLEISYQDYGDAIEITGDHSITSGGVYFVSQNGVTLTYELETTLKDLVIIPTTADVTAINLTIKKQIYFTGTFACQNVVFENAVPSQYPLRAKETVGKVVFDKCKVNGLLNGRGLIMPNTQEVDGLSYFEMSNSDVRLNKSGLNVYLVQEMNCSKLVFNNNIVYFSGIVPNTQTSDGHIANFRIFNGGTSNSNTSRKIIDDLFFSSNTLIDVESSSGSGVTGLIYCGEARNIVMNNNIYWLSFPATEFGKTNPTVATVMLRWATLSTSINSQSNFGYCGNSEMKLKVCYANSLPEGLNELILKDDLFNITDENTFNKSNGTFTPTANYKAYGAQR